MKVIVFLLLCLSAASAVVDKVLAKADTRTADLGGRLGTRAFGEAVAAAL